MARVNHNWNPLGELATRICNATAGHGRDPMARTTTGAAAAAVLEHSSDADDSMLLWNTPPAGGWTHWTPLVLECFWMVWSKLLLEAGIMLVKPGNKLMFHHNITICAVKSSSKHYHCPSL